MLKMSSVFASMIPRNGNAGVSDRKKTRLARGPLVSLCSLLAKEHPCKIV